MLQRYSKTWVYPAGRLRNSVTVLCHAAVVDDLLFALMALDGRYARARLVDRDSGSGGGAQGPGGRRLTYVLEGHFDPSLHDLASRILPMWCAMQCPLLPHTCIEFVGCALQVSRAPASSGG